MTCSITPGSGGLIVSTPFNPAFVAAFKAGIPATDRRYEPNTRTWIISPAFGDYAAKLIQKHYGEAVQLPLSSGAGRPVMRMLDVRYIGPCKIREDGSSTAFGWSVNAWSVIFPEPVLRAWFDIGPEPAAINTATLYSVLGARQGMTADDLKAAYRRAALTWHPDRCKDADAGEMFLKVQHAWEVLSSPLKRERYDAGLAFEASLGKMARKEDEYKMQASTWRAPLKSGLILANGRDTVGRFVVEKINAWEDIVDAYGRTLITSWPMGAVCPVETWA